MSPAAPNFVNVSSSCLKFAWLTGMKAKFRAAAPFAPISTRSKLPPTTRKPTHHQPNTEETTTT